MDPIERKQVTVITKYAVESFTESDWYSLGQITGKLNVIKDHPRLFRSMSFGDDDYGACAAEVLDTIFSDASGLIPEVVDNFDIDLWYQQRNPEKYRRVFTTSTVTAADFWKVGYLKVFVSHLSSNKRSVSAMKADLDNWGISAFIAHEDIEPSREWMNEVEAGLQTMDVMVAVVEPGFVESLWCAQEVGFALGRQIDIIPLDAGLKPYGFFGKYQAIPIKGKFPEEVAEEITQLLLKKPKHRDRLLQSMSKAFSGLPSTKKQDLFDRLDSWSVVTDDQLKILLETSSLSSYEHDKLKHLILRVGAFPPPTATPPDYVVEDDIPF